MTSAVSNSASKLLLQAVGKNLDGFLKVTIGKEIEDFESGSKGKVKVSFLQPDLRGEEGTKHGLVFAIAG